MRNIFGYKQIGKLAFPIIAAQSVVLLNGMIDLAFVGPLGTEAIAAVAVANALCAVIFNFLEGLRLGTTVLVARFSASGEKAKATAAINHGFLAVGVVGAITLFFAPLISGKIYAVFGSVALAQYGTAYLTIWLRSIPVILCSYVVTGLFRGLGDAATPLYATAVSCGLNAALDYLLVSGNLGFPALGVAGAAWGTLLANTAGVLLLSCLAWKKPLIRQYLALQQISWRALRQYVVFAAEIGLNTGGTLLALLFFVVIIRPLGAAALAVHQITLQVFNLAYLPGIGFLITASIIAPQLLGRGETEELLPAVKRISVMSFANILLVSGALFACALSVSSFFSSTDSVVAKEAAKTLRLVCIGQLFSSLYMVMRGALTGCGDTRFIACEGWISAYVVFLPAAYWLAIQLDYGVYGGYTAFVLWCAVDCLALSWRFYCRKPWEKETISKMTIY